MATRKPLVQVGGDITELPTGDLLETGGLPTVATFADLPANVAGTNAILYYVEADENTNNEPTLYACKGTTKIWLAGTPG